VVVKKDRLRLVLMVSGGGTTMLEIIRACKSGRLSRVDPVLVISSKPDAPAIEKAREEGVSVACASPSQYSSREEFGEQLIVLCDQMAADVVGQYGWMPLTPANMIEEYVGKMINQHPGPLDPGKPDFGGKGMYGTRVHAARLFFVRATGHDYWTEATAQRVATNYDQGLLLNKRKVVIRTDDTPVSLQERVLPVEHDVQIQTLEMLSINENEGCLRSDRLVRSGEVAALAQAKQAAGLLFPKG